MINNKKLSIMFFVMMFSFFSFALIGDAFAVNATMINELEEQLRDETEFTNTFPAFWLVFMLVLLGVFMGVMLKMREDREMVYFSIAAIIISLLITFLMSAPVTFDYQEIHATITIEEINNENGTFYNSKVSHGVKQVPLMPNNQEFRLSMVALFTGNTLFCGLYTIYIITNYKGKNR